MLSGDKEFVDTEIDTWLEEIEMPLEFSLQYGYDGQGHLCVDLDLPEIEDLPDEVATQLANGNLKLKKKSQTNMREDYARCIFGLAVFFASHFFNVAVNINRILLSGFTQRRDKDGNLNDDYIFSIIFTRPEFEKTNVSNLDPIDFCMTFENRCNRTKTNIFKAIKPFENAAI